MSQAFIPAVKSSSLFLNNANRRETFDSRLTELPPFLADERDTEGVNPVAGEQPFIAAITPTIRVQAQLTRIAEFDLPVLIRGEKGSGESSVARLLHKLSPRNQKPFGEVNCAAIAEGELDQELFGSKASPGILEMCEGGTVFLKEITSLPTRLQGKLCSFLDDRRLFRPGTQKLVHANVRVIASSVADIRQSVESGKLRPELYYRLHALVMHLPRLRHRYDFDRRSETLGCAA